MIKLRLKAIGLLIFELFDEIWWEVPVESRQSDFRLIDNIADKRLVHDIFEHGLGVLRVCSFMASGLPHRR